MMNWFVLFTLSGKEERVANHISKFFDSDTLVPFVPKREILFKWHGRVNKNIEILFPGYVFVKSGMKNLEFAKISKIILQQANGTIRLLGDKEHHHYQLSSSDRVFLDELLDQNYCLGSSVGIIDSNRVVITEGPLQGRESTVIKIDRHKRQAVVEFSFMGAVRQMAVALDIIEKYD